MDISLFPEELRQATKRAKFIARLALFLSAPLNWVSPLRIELILSRLTRNLPAATYEQAYEMRNAVCSVSKRCCSQEGCIRRSLAVIIALCLKRCSASWCTGFAQEPFRAHAWIEVNNIAVGEPEEIVLYSKMINVAQVSEDDSQIENVEYTANLKNPKQESKKNVPLEDKNLPMPSVSVRSLFSLTKGHRKEFIIITILGIISAALTLLQPNLIGDLLNQAGTAFEFGSTFWILIFILLASTCLTAFQYYLLQKVGEGVVFKARKNLISHMFRLPISEFDLRNVGDLLSRFSSDTSRLRLAIIQGTVAITSGIFLVIGAVIGMAFIDIFLFFLTISTVAITLISVLFMSHIVQRASYNMQQELGKLSGLVERDLHAIRTIKATTATLTEEEKIVARIENLKKLGIHLAKIQSLMTPISNLFLQICGFLVLGIGGYRVTLGYMEISDLIAFSLMLYILVGPTGQILSSLSEVGESLGSFSRIREILDLPTESEYDLLPVKTSIEKENSNFSLSFNHVDFTYKKTKFGSKVNELDDMVLKNISFNVKKGEHIAIVGPSGAGKSTILQLLERFYEPSNGQIVVNGKDYRAYTREDLRKLMTYVEQDAPVISGTLRENLLLGNTGITDEECLQALQKVNLNHLVERSTDGLDASVGEAGSGLSGGERQRLAMARSLLSKAEIVLLDESTSNLDSLNESIIKKVVSDLKGPKTIIIVAHRLSTIVDSDTIYVLEHGRIVGVGNHEQLLEEVPLYKELAKEQAIY